MLLLASMCMYMGPENPLAGPSPFKEGPLTWRLLGAVVSGGRPTELLVKQLAIIGSTGLMAAFSLTRSPEVSR